MLRYNVYLSSDARKDLKDDERGLIFTVPGALSYRECETYVFFFQVLSVTISFAYQLTVAHSIINLAESVGFDSLEKVHIDRGFCVLCVYISFRVNIGLAVPEGLPQQ